MLKRSVSLEREQRIKSKAKKKEKKITVWGRKKQRNSLSLFVPLPSLNSPRAKALDRRCFSFLSPTASRVKFYLRRRAARERERKKEIIRDARGLRRRLSRFKKKRIGEKQERREICALSNRSYVNDTHLEATTRDDREETPTE